MWELSVIFALMLANGFFAAAEIALVSIRPSRVRELVDAGSSRARLVQSLKHDPDRLFATVQVGITIVGSTASVLGGAALVEMLAGALGRLAPGSWLEAHAGGISLAVVIAAISYLELVVGELVPKSIAHRHPDKLALMVAVPISWLATVARPVVWVLTASSNALLRPFRDRTSFSETRISQEELRMIIEESAREGGIARSQGELLSSVIDFVQTTAGQVMVPRTGMVALKDDATQDEIVRVLTETGHTRVPVYKGSLDQIVGVVNAKDALVMAWHRQLVVLQDMLRPPTYVPESTPLPALLRKMQQERVHLIIVTDEFGGTAGIITLRDVVEEIVGEIYDEREVVTKSLERLPDGTWRAVGRTRVSDFNEKAGTHLSEEQPYETLAGLVLHVAGRIPQKGEVFDAEGHRFEVTQRTERAILELRVRPSAPREPRA